MNASTPATNKPLRWYHGLKPYHWWVFCVGALAWLFDCTDQRIFMLARSPGLSQLLGLPQTDRLVVDYATSPHPSSSTRFSPACAGWRRRGGTSASIGC